MKVIDFDKKYIMTYPLGDGVNFQSAIVKPISKAEWHYINVILLEKLTPGYWMVGTHYSAESHALSELMEPNDILKEML